MPDHPLPTRIPQVAVDLCRACRRCHAREVCRSKALRAVDPGEPPWVDGNRCYGCLACVPACPFGAIQIPPPEVPP
ncbi:MAG: ATP-binding protein [Anaerolineae bacterium]